MTNEPKTRSPYYDAPFRKATEEKMSASGPGDRIASTRDVAIFFREDCRPLEDSLQLEMVVAQYCLRIRDVVDRSGVPVGDAVGDAVIAELEGHRDALSHAILRGIAHIGCGDLTKRAAEAAARLANRVVGLPQQFADACKAKPLGAWRTSEGAHEGEFAFFLDFEHPRGRRHGLALFVDSDMGVKHLGLTAAITDLGTEGPFHPNVMEKLETREAGELLHNLLDDTYGPQRAETDDFRVLIAGARARAMLPEAERMSPF